MSMASTQATTTLPTLVNSIDVPKSPKRGSDS